MGALRAMRDMRGGAMGGFATDGPRVEAPWAEVLDRLCAVLGQAPTVALPAIAATIRLDRAGGEGLRLLRTCAELERRHGLALDVRHDAMSPPGMATYVVRIHRRTASG